MNALLIRRAFTTPCVCKFQLHSRSLSSQVRVRFAPSPTGYLHLGGLRTALFNYLLAKKTGGKFILRIEDTDQKRLVLGSKESLQKTLQWAGLNYDEGPSVGGPYAPYVQSERLDLYKNYSEKLLERGAAYRCFCTPERLEHMKASAEKTGKANMYDRTCMHLHEDIVKQKLEEGTPYTIRFKVPSGVSVTEDKVYGVLRFEHTAMEDFILMKSDGFPTYHLANIVDDHTMCITHVIRGEEWIPSLGKHLALYRALDLKAPVYAHVPLLINENKAKLSKRQNDAFVQHYVDKGYLKGALLNFVALLGWRPEGTEEIFTLDELATKFSLEQINRSAAVVDFKKLNWINKQHIARACAAGPESPAMQECIEQLKDSLALSGLTREPTVQHASSDDYLADVIDIVKERVSLVTEIPSFAGYFWQEPTWQDEESITLHKAVWKANAASLAHSLLSQLRELPDSDFNSTTIARVFDGLAVGGVKKNDVMLLARYCVTGKKVGATLPRTLERLGKDAVLRRIENVLARNQN
eukprot:Colp12_sorted_trinity150504_noHs@3517